MRGLLASGGGWLTEVSNHSDPHSQRFFMRNDIALDSLPFGIEEFRQGFLPLARRHKMEFSIRDSAALKRVVILVSRQEHGLVDLLHPWRIGELRFDLRAVVSNHADTRAYVEHHDVAFHHVPVPAEPQAKAEAFARMEALLDAEAADLIVLARYMQILPPSLCDKCAVRIVTPTTS